MKLVNQNDRIGLLDGDIIGVSYKITAEQKTDIKVRNEYIYSDDIKQENYGLISTNKEYTSSLLFQDLDNIPFGKMTFRINFPENKDIETIEQVFYIYNLRQGLVFNNTPFPPATQNDIFDFEKKYSTSFCDDYKHFLNTQNGLDLCWWKNEWEFDIKKDAYQANKYGFIQTYYPFYDELTHLTQEWEQIFQIDKIFGLGNKNPYLDIHLVNMEQILYHNDILRYIYPIGEDAGGNNLIQITEWKYRNKLAILDHEISSILWDWLYKRQQDIFNKALKDTYVDDFVEKCVESGIFCIYDISFNELLDELLKRHKVVYQKLKKIYSL